MRLNLRNVLQKDLKVRGWGNWRLGILANSSQKVCQLEVLCSCCKALGSPVLGSAILKDLPECRVIHALSMAEPSMQPRGSGMHRSWCSPSRQKPALSGAVGQQIEICPKGSKHLTCSKATRPDSSLYTFLLKQVDACASSRCQP